MQITNQINTNMNPTMTDTPIELKQGEVYKAQIKERISDSEAIIGIRGKEIHAKFEGSVPTGDRATVQVTGQQDGAVL